MTPVDTAALAAAASDERVGCFRKVSKLAIKIEEENRGPDHEMQQRNG